MEEESLVPFLMSRKKEVEDIMVTLFDQAKVMELHDFNVMREARFEGERARALSIAGRMLRRQRPIEEIVEDTGLSHEEVESLERELDEKIKPSDCD